MSAVGYFDGPVRTWSWRGWEAETLGEAALITPRTVYKAHFYLHWRQKGFPNTKKKSFKIKFTRCRYANDLEKQNPTMFSKFYNSLFN